jgi:hypothetical protein
MARITAVCVGDVKGGPKRRVGQAHVAKNFGLSGDADTGPRSRQVALLDLAEFLSRSVHQPDLAYGHSGENLVVDGLDFRSLKPGATLRIGDALLEFVGPVAGSQLYQAKARLAGIVTEGDQIVIETNPS